MSFLISFEGCEGTGKTTQVTELVRRLNQLNHDVFRIREPGSTKLGDYLRLWLKDETREALSPESEVFLFAAARAALVRDVIIPLLARPNSVVIVDRYIDSTIAYQGYGRGIGLEEIKMVNKISTQGTEPDLTILLDAPVGNGLRRVSSGTEGEIPVRHDKKGTRRFEEEPLEFHERVRSGYLSIAKDEPERIVQVDATGSIGEIADTIWGIVQSKLNLDGKE